MGLKFREQHKPASFVNFCVSCIILTCVLIQTLTLEANERTVRVGWYYQPSYMQLRSDGKLSEEQLGEFMRAVRSAA